MVLKGVSIWLRHWVDGLGLGNWDRHIWVMVLLGVYIWLRRWVDGLGLGSWYRHVWIMVLADWLGLVLDFVRRRWLFYLRLRLVEVGVLLWLLVGLLLWRGLLVGLLLLLSLLMV